MFFVPSDEQKKCPCINSNEDVMCIALNYATGYCCLKLDCEVSPYKDTEAESDGNDQQ